MAFLKKLKIKASLKLFAYFSKASIFFINIYIKSQAKKS